MATKPEQREARRNIQPLEAGGYSLIRLGRIVQKSLNQKRSSDMLVKCFGEFMGTLVLVLLGDGVVANVLLKRSKAEGAGWMVITSGWAFAVMAGVFTAIACGSGDAHLNPAVTMGFAVSSGQFTKFGPYLVAQMAGAFAGGTFVLLHLLR